MAEVQIFRVIRVFSVMSVIHRKGEQRRNPGLRRFDGCSVESMRGLHLQREGCFSEQGFVESGCIAEFARQPSCVPVQSLGRSASLLYSQDQSQLLADHLVNHMLRDATASGGKSIWY